MADANELWNKRAAIGRMVGEAKELTDDELEALARQLVGHHEGGEEEVFLGTVELGSLLREVIQHRQGYCHDCRREHVVRERVWGYDG